MLIIIAFLEESLLEGHVNIFLLLPSESDHVFDNADHCYFANCNI